MSVFMSAYIRKNQQGGVALGIQTTKSFYTIRMQKHECGSVQKSGNEQP